MKPHLVKILVCPVCGAELNLRSHTMRDAEVMQGTLQCRACGKEYPVSRGVPRFVNVDAYASSFGYQWNRFKTVQLDSLNGTQESEATLEATTGWKDEDYQGRLVLDAGVGAGRFAEIAAKKGGEVVGIDLSSAIDAAFANIGRRERIHLIQADIFALPFREGTFDLAYSVGVLHHTPDPRAAFERVAKTVKHGGGLAVFLYNRYGPGHHGSDLIRSVTTRLPAKLMFVIAAGSIPLYYLYRVPILGKVLHLLCPISMHPNWRWRWLDTFDWYTPKYQWKLLYPEVIRWFRANGFLDITVFDIPIQMRGVKTNQERPSTRPVLKFIEPERSGRRSEDCSMEVPR